MSVSTRTRFNVFKRDAFTCQYCGRTPPTVTLECDHVIPSSKGGSDEFDNLTTACFECNSGKSNIELDKLPESVAEKLAIAEERALQLKRYNDFLKSQRREIDDLADRLGQYWYSLLDESDITFGKYRQQSIRMFLKFLPETKIIEAMDVASNKYPCVTHKTDERMWKYFCGVCWNMTKEAK